LEAPYQVSINHFPQLHRLSHEVRVALMDLVPLEKLSYESFARLVKKVVRLRLDEGLTLPLTVLEVSPRRVVPAGGADGKVYENFSLTFLGPAERLLPQQIYQLEAEEIGRFELFLVPLKQEPEGIQYQATFNRLTTV